MSESKVSNLNRVAGAVVGFLTTGLLRFLTSMLLVAMDVSDNAVMVILFIVALYGYYLVYRGIRYGLGGMFVPQGKIIDLREEDKTQDLTDKHNNTNLDNLAQNYLSSIQEPGFEGIINQELDFMRNDFFSCVDIFDELKKYANKNNHKIMSQIEDEGITILQWIHLSLKTLSAKKVENGGFVYRGLPDLTGVEYMKLFEFSTDKLAELKYKDYTSELANKEKQAFREHLAQHFG